VCDNVFMQSSFEIHFKGNVLFILSQEIGARSLRMSVLANLVRYSKSAYLMLQSKATHVSVQKDLQELLVTLTFLSAMMNRATYLVIQCPLLARVMLSIGLISLL
jgi:hypothetical protein